MNPEIIGHLFFFGLLTGGIYALISIGLSLIYGILKVVNFAQGEFFMLGAFICYFLMTLLNAHPILAIMAAALATFIIGVVMEKVVIFPLRRRGGRGWLMNTLIATLGVSLILQNSALIVCGAYHRGVSYMWSPGTLDFLGIRFSIDRLIILLVAISIISTFYAFIQFTYTGKAIRATAQNIDAAMSVGVNINTIYTLACGLSTMLAGIAGAIMLPISTVYPTVGYGYLLTSFIVVILGGLGNLYGSMLAAFIVGLIQSFTTYYFGMGWSSFFLFIFIAIVLLIRPSGILGEKGA